MFDSVGTDGYLEKTEGLAEYMLGLDSAKKSRCPVPVLPGYVHPL